MRVRLDDERSTDLDRHRDASAAASAGQEVVSSAIIATPGSTVASIRPSGIRRARRARAYVRRAPKRRAGGRNARILFASWDAEELTLTSSTEWGEQREAWLRDRAVAYLNVDSAASGSRFVAGAVPSLMRVIAGAADAVRDPLTRVSIAAAARSRWSMDARRSSSGPRCRDRRRSARRRLRLHRLSQSSGCACRRPGLRWSAACLPLGLRHPSVRGADWDPGFRYTATLVKVLGIAALRLMEADVIPLDFRAAAAGVVEVHRGDAANACRAASRRCWRRLREALGALELAAAAFSAARDAASHAGDQRIAWLNLNRRAMRPRAAFIEPCRSARPALVQAPPGCPRSHLRAPRPARHCRRHRRRRFAAARLPRQRGSHRRFGGRLPSCADRPCNPPPVRCRSNSPR